MLPRRLTKTQEMWKECLVLSTKPTRAALSTTHTGGQFNFLSTKYRYDPRRDNCFGVDYQPPTPAPAREHIIGEDKYTFVEECHNPASVTILIKAPNKYTITQVKVKRRLFSFDWPSAFTFLFKASVVVLSKDTTRFRDVCILLRGVGLLFTKASFDGLGLISFETARVD